MFRANWADHWRSIKLLLLHLVGFYFTLPTLMMHGQTQIKFILSLCAVSPMVHTSNICSCQKKKIQFSCGCEQFHWGRSFGFLVINVCSQGEHYETPCIHTHIKQLSSFIKFRRDSWLDEESSASQMDSCCTVVYSLLDLSVPHSGNARTRPEMQNSH